MDGQFSGKVGKEFGFISYRLPKNIASTKKIHAPPQKKSISFKYDFYSSVLKSIRYFENAAKWWKIECKRIQDRGFKNSPVLYFWNQANAFTMHSDALWLSVNSFKDVRVGDGGRRVNAELFRHAIYPALTPIKTSSVIETSQLGRWMDLYSSRQYPAW